MPTESHEKMVIKSISVPVSLWARAIKKARDNAQSLSAVIRKLLEKWLNNEIDL